MDVISPVDRLRIAIALAALRYKPPSQSASSYVLGLRVKFVPIGASPPTSDKSWKSHALQLEMEYASLKAQYETERIKSAMPLNLSQTTSSQSDELETLPLIGAAKKKSGRKKKNVPADSPPPTIRPENVMNLVDRWGLPLLAKESLLSMVDSLSRLVIIPQKTAVVEEAIATALQRTVDMFSKEFRQVLNAPEPAPNHVKILDMLTKLTDYIFSTALPTAIGSSHERFSQLSLDEIFGCLVREIAPPAISSFLPLSERHLQMFIQPPLKTPEIDAVDIRYGVLAVLQTTFSCLFTIKPHPCSHTSDPGTICTAAALDSLRMSLILEILKELCRMIYTGTGAEGKGFHCVGENWERTHPRQDLAHPLSSGSGSAASVPDKPPKTEKRRIRIKKLAIKDAFWFLCTVLHSLSVPDFHGLSEHSVRHDLRDDCQAPDKLYCYGKSMRTMQLAIRNTLLNLVLDCQAAQRNYRRFISPTNDKSRPDMASQVDSPAETHESEPRSPSNTRGGQQAQEPLATNEDNQKVVHGVEEGLIDETGYSMLLGVVEQFLMPTSQV
ncbi:hypothetical protein FA15DRAFT_596790 [Coprinopsis marcescibilis]|uniref:Uncharacterized protein n=1 Tax=Coprinopsis marcescibilis TaxID=230819 RepID=A0A5C3KPH6_COPMA|nr:hypothetical protein FA15DRAFT_596790 [Coprinopsis marcescibilis]